MCPPMPIATGAWLFTPATLLMQRVMDRAADPFPISDAPQVAHAGMPTVCLLPVNAARTHV